MKGNEKMNQKHTHGITAPTYGAASNHGINIAKEKRISELLNGTEKNALLDYFVNLAGAIYELEKTVSELQIENDLCERGIISG